MSIIEQLKELEKQADLFLKDLIDHDFYPGNEKHCYLKTVSGGELQIHKFLNNEEQIYIRFYESDTPVIDMYLPNKIVRVFSKLESFLLQTNPDLYQEFADALIDYYENLSSFENDN